MLRPNQKLGARWIPLIIAGCAVLGLNDPAIAAGPPLPPVMAGVPGTDQYDVLDGTITMKSGYTCADLILTWGAGSDCQVSMSDNGMLQRELTVPSGVSGILPGTYIQFVMVDPGTTGSATADPFSAARGNLNFTNEDFIQMSNRSDGLSSTQLIVDSEFIDPDTEDRFVNSVRLNWGWAENQANPYVDAYQYLGQIDYTDYNINPLNDPIERFYATMRVRSDALTWDNERKVVIEQGVDLTEGTDTGLQKFNYTDLAGTYNTSCHHPDVMGGLETILCPEPQPDLLPGGTNGGDISWNLYERITALWVGQVIGGDGQHGYTRFAVPGRFTDTGKNSFWDPEAAAWPNNPFGLAINPRHPFSPKPAGLDTIANGVATVAATDDGGVGAATGLAADTSLGHTLTGTADTTIQALPITYNNWTVSNGVFTVPCPLTLPDKCFPPIVNQGGLYQRVIEVGGVRYVQTIVTETNATGDPTTADFNAGGYLGFRNEAIVNLASVVGGIASALHIAEGETASYLNQVADFTHPSYVPFPLSTHPDGGGTGAHDHVSAGEFVYDVQVKTGWAHGGDLDATVDIAQRVTAPDYIKDNTTSMEELFRYRRGETARDVSMDMFSVASTSQATKGFTDPIYFATARRTGWFNDSQHLSGDGAQFTADLQSASGELTWSRGDALELTWLGSVYNSSDPLGPTAVDSVSVTNLTTGNRIQATVSNGTKGPKFDTGTMDTVSAEEWTGGTPNTADTELETVFGLAPVDGTTPGLGFAYDYTIDPWDDTTPIAHLSTW